MAASGRESETTKRGRLKREPAGMGDEKGTSSKKAETKNKDTGTAARKQEEEQNRTRSKEKGCRMKTEPKGTTKEGQTQDQGAQCQVNHDQQSLGEKNIRAEQRQDKTKTMKRGLSRRGGRRGQQGRKGV